MFGITFKDFIIEENKVYLGQKIGDILSALQELDKNKIGMGTRQLVSNSERIVAQIRKILHGNWSKKEKQWLIFLQKVGVAISKALEEKDQLEDVISSCVHELENLLTKMKVPMNSLGEKDIEDIHKRTDEKQVEEPDERL